MNKYVEWINLIHTWKQLASNIRWCCLNFQSVLKVMLTKIKLKLPCWLRNHLNWSYPQKYWVIYSDKVIEKELTVQNPFYVEKLQWTLQIHNQNSFPQRWVRAVEVTLEQWQLPNKANAERPCCLFPPLRSLLRVPGGVQPSGNLVAAGHSSCHRRAKAPPHFGFRLQLVTCNIWPATGGHAIPFSFFLLF